MLIDTHCHVNIIIKKNFQDAPMNDAEYNLAHEIITEAQDAQVSTIINVGTSIIESQNCIEIALRNKNAYAVIGIHPNDLTHNWKGDITTLKKKLQEKNTNKVVGVGECGLDYHYPEYNKQQQYDAFKAQIELALEYNVGLVVHSRDAYDETLYMLEEYKNDALRGVLHCFSYDLSFAQQVIEWGFVLGIGGTITYPKNNTLRDVVSTVSIHNIVLETDAPFLPPQIIRGKKNHPRYIVTIAEYIAILKKITLSDVAQATTTAARTLFTL